MTHKLNWGRGLKRVWLITSLVWIVIACYFGEEMQHEIFPVQKWHCTTFCGEFNLIEDSALTKWYAHVESSEQYKAASLEEKNLVRDDFFNKYTLPKVGLVNREPAYTEFSFSVMEAKDLLKDPMFVGLDIVQKHTILIKNLIAHGAPIGFVGKDFCFNQSDSNLRAICSKFGQLQFLYRLEITTKFLIILLIVPIFLPLLLIGAWQIATWIIKGFITE